MGDRTRREIMLVLAERPRAVGELAAELSVSRPAVSQHLTVLKDAGLVTERAERTRRIYRLNEAASSRSATNSTSSGTVPWAGFRISPTNSPRRSNEPDR